MPAKVDLTGRTFNRLTVTGEAPRRGKRVRWFASCSCGSKPDKSYDANLLVYGSTGSCGCARRESRPIADRLRAKLVEDPATGCLLWSGFVMKNGYGTIGRTRIEKVLVHRVAWEVANGRSVPEGMCVMHTCDVRRCCNPQHLVLGTYAENTADMLAKERGKYGAKRLDKNYRGSDAITHVSHEGQPGEANPMAKLKEAQVREIRALLKTERYTRAEIGLRYGVGVGCIEAIAIGKTWKHVS